MLKIKRENLNLAFEKISENMDLFLPVKKAGEVNFGRFEKGVNVSLDTLKTVKSAKDFFFPQSETMMKFKLEGKNIEINDIREDKSPFVIFGFFSMHPLSKTTCRFSESAGLTSILFVLVWK